MISASEKEPLELTIITSNFNNKHMKHSCQSSNVPSLKSVIGNKIINSKCENSIYTPGIFNSYLLKHIEEIT